jgi:hypothetical protein
VLAENSWLITTGASLDGKTVQRTFFRLSEPCQLADCDAFFSHSWHDDGFLKWNALKVWCEKFRAECKRSPSIWLDKVCIDQANVEEDLPCLPLFVAGCNSMLIVTGASYTSRLWCCVELFVHMSMQLESQMRRAMHVILIGTDEAEKDKARQSWHLFNASACRCFNPDDKRRILGIVDQHPGGIQAFNSYIRSLADSLFEGNCRSCPLTNHVSEEDIVVMSC